MGNQSSRLSFDVIDDPWLDVTYNDGSTARISLRELLRSAHLIFGLSESSPLTEVALLRFLIAFFSDGLRDLLHDETDWKKFAEQTLKGISTDIIESILAPLAGRSDVFHESHDAFFDGPSVKQIKGSDDPGSWQPASRFLPELPTGTNLAHFVHLSDDTAALCVACLLKSRAVDAAFARGGLGPSLSRNLLATIGGIEPRYLIVVGSTLLETLLLNAVVADESRPSWVSIHRPKNGNPGPVARMSWRPRLAQFIKQSQSLLPCVCCGSTEYARFTKAVMVDTYNRNSSPFGTKEDVGSWKVAGGDPQIMSFATSELTFGSNPLEWPLRAIALILSSEAPPACSRLLERIAEIGRPVTITVTSSDGNQAKIDDAPAASVTVPQALVKRSPEERSLIADALVIIFDKSFREQRSLLIPSRVSELLISLSLSLDPQQTVTNWLRSDVVVSRGEKDDTTDDGARIAARRAVERLQQLSIDKLAALRRRGIYGVGRDAEWQSAFEDVWHSLPIPGGQKRRQFRDAVATIAAIYAVHPDRHQLANSRYSFEKIIRRRLNSERRLTMRSGRGSPIEELLTQLCRSTSTSRDLLLTKFVGSILAERSNAESSRIDFGDLLLDVANWNDPENPTSDRWRKLLSSKESVAFATQKERIEA